MSDESKNDALGAQLIANDKWLVTNVLKADHWAQGTAQELLDGSAWRRFTQRLGELAERIQAAHAPSTPLDRAEGYRYLSMLLRNAFDVAIEDIDPERPTFNWLTRRNKLGWDCPDALYAYAAIRGDATYRIAGRRSTVHFLGLQIMAGIRSLHNSHADEWQVGADGRFEVVVGGPRSKGNWIPLDGAADTIWMRQFFYDWEHEQPASLWIDRIDGGKRTEPNGVLDPGFLARRLDAVATNVEANVDLWLFTVIALRERYCNVFPAESFGGTQMGAQKHQRAGVCYFRLADDEALLIEVTPPRAKYWSIDVCTFWLESLDYANHQSSLNGHQAVVDADGVFRAVVAPQDPGVPNWLDTVGHSEGSLIYRWNLAEATPVPVTRVITLTALREHLHPSTPEVSRAERRRRIDVRREHVRRRFARPL
ncbi:MAG TPA: DUF1214 domain-containing protein [Candidatus Margulisiibacteriota bacterium]|nr:DUF1214 domain-containing protein [Candidatus Margulisiibacteriota bacterium]